MEHDEDLKGRFPRAKSTPREPDRFDAQAREVWASCLHGGDSPSHEPIAAALRAEARDARQDAIAVIRANLVEPLADAVIRALKDPAAAPAHPMLEPLGFCDRPGFHDHPHRKQSGSGTVNAKGEPQGCINWRPAAAPAADVKVNACQVDLRTDRDRECFDDIVQAATRVLRSASAAAQGAEAPSCHGCETKMQRIAELNAILRRALYEEGYCEITTAGELAAAPKGHAAGCYAGVNTGCNCWVGRARFLAPQTGEGK